MLSKYLSQLENQLLICSFFQADISSFPCVSTDGTKLDKEMGRYPYAQSFCPWQETFHEKACISLLRPVNQLEKILVVESLLHCQKEQGMVKDRRLFHAWGGRQLPRLLERPQSLLFEYCQSLNALSKVIFRLLTAEAFSASSFNSSSNTQFSCLQLHETLPGQKMFMSLIALITYCLALKVIHEIIV